MEVAGLITAKEFANQGASWHRVAPTLEQYTRWANRQLMSLGPPVPRLGVADRASLVAEAAFEAVATNVSPEMAAEVARRRLRGLRGYEFLAGGLTEHESTESDHLASYLETYLDRFPGQPRQFRPQFRGCGVVMSTEGDIRVADELIEVKTVQRSFGVADYRQALTYVALAYSEGDEIDRVCLLNPRRARYYSVSVESLALDIGAGSRVELLQDLVAEMSSGIAVSG